MGYLLDTNIVSLLIRREQSITRRFYSLKALDKKFYISGITYFEIRRGLLAKNALAQMKRFERLQGLFEIVMLDDLAIFEQAAIIYANLKTRGLIIQSEDILIAATGMIKGLTVVSRDEDLARIEGLNLENWLN
jgi:tRNA(fMet)-specific endonuclease VapC